MQLSEYVQIACAALGLSGVALVRVSYMRRRQADPSVGAYDRRERLIRALSWALIAVGLVLVFIPFA
ncbi:hypothetical protein [Collinsella vaginalis]|uniref:hypothetical protein n=1 Tax=Collinsella vaginalis TaxID=1870987 RepID=UPI000A26CE0F|nr:hypothetical protein [Collinsella vaginalis]